MIVRSSPGACPICGAAHSTCTASAGAITSVMAPARDAAALVQTSAPAPVRLVADEVQATLPPGSFTSATYRKPKRS
jgi:hypothetical protein